MSAAAPTLVSLFTGAGGLDVGLERAGWDTVFATDLDRDAIASLEQSKDARIPIRGRADRTHLDRARIVLADVADLTASDVRPPGARKEWRPSLLAGGPPCQPWSSAGLQRGFADRRGRLFDHFVRLTDELRPRYVLMENVRGLLTARGPSGRPGEALELIQASFEDVGYATSFAVLNAADFGAGQRRVRLFMVATADRVLPAFPEPTHRRVGSVPFFDDRKPWVTLAEVLTSMPRPDHCDVVRPSGARANTLRALEPGTGIRTGGVIEANRPSGHWGYRQDSFLADPSLPSRTIRAAATPDWIRDETGDLRRLTWRECAALQGFPQTWMFAATTAARFRLIGNAVQADVAEAVGRAVLVGLRATKAPRPPKSAPWPAEFKRRVDYTAMEHRVNGAARAAKRRVRR